MLQKCYFSPYFRQIICYRIITCEIDKKLRKKLIKSMYFLFILYIFCNSFVNAVCYFCIIPVFYCFK